jgi:hypothetical protein
MHGERDYLTRYVFPELQERCRKRKVHVTPIGTLLPINT